MKKNVALILLALITLAPVEAFAEGTADILNLVQVSRQKVTALMAVDDEAAQNAIINEINAATQEIDMRTDSMLADESTPDNVKQNLEAFKTVWADVVQTRDGEMIPAVLAGDKEKAKKTGQTTQTERFKKIQELLK